MTRRWLSASCRSTSASGSSFFFAVIRALKRSMPPYVVEYRGGFLPSRTVGRCSSVSSSHVVTCAMMSRTDQSPVTPGSRSCSSDRPANDALNATHALWSRSRTCLRSTLVTSCSLLSHRGSADESARQAQRQVEALSAQERVAEEAPQTTTSPCASGHPAASLAACHDVN